MRIYLIGMPLSGKSTVGKLVSEKLNLEFIDLDELIVNTFNESIDEMFNKGEDYFRNRETEALKSVLFKDNVIISCGGGIVVKEINYNYLDGLIIYLNVDLEILEKRYNFSLNTRPLLKDNKLAKLYELRKDKYEKLADKIINNLEIEKTVEEIVGYYYENISN